MAKSNNYVKKRVIEGLSLMNRIRFLHKTSLVTIIGVVLLVASVIPVRADSLQQQLNQSKQQANQINGALTAQHDKVAGVTTQVLALKQSVLVLNSSMAREQLALAEEQHNLKDLEDQQQKLEDQRQEHIKALGNVLKGNYEDGVTTYVAVLFQATSVSDFIDRADKIQMIVGGYSKLQKDIIALNSTLNDQKELIKQKQNTIQASIQAKAQTQQAAQQTLDKQQTILAQLSTTERAMLNSSVSAQSKVSRIQKLIEQEEIEAAYAAKEGSSNAGNSDRSSSGGGVSGTVKVAGGAQQILSFAAQFQGLPYVWGGTTPSPGFDCSGYVQYVYQHAGISLNRTSEQQFNDGVPVSRSELQPGDIVFFHTYSSGASHVGIYAGNNTMLDSSNGGVSYDDMTNSYWASRYLGARRVVAS
ncbi:NlpC/P60 family protein [Candidatus Desulfosporosinus infrequens]|uniref:NlpC/P60 family protein n=1 Tax=Candidatus Desulfosporosinus infrequens TaxID=2043169 RepID=A0A2U3KGJ5_9FIRM|nr:NlpC/P60 family protein [Candidatus Desulfosporosinus infrequens]